MATIISFSGTGNSYYIAKLLAASLNAKHIKLTNDNFTQCAQLQDDVVGLVYPVYHKSMPNIIGRLAREMSLTGIKHLFVVVTYGDQPTMSVVRLNRILSERGRPIDASYGIKMPYNFIQPTKFGKGIHDSYKFRKVSDDISNETLAIANSRIEAISISVSNCEMTEMVKSFVWLESVSENLGLRDGLQKTMWLKAMHYDGAMPVAFEQSIPLMDYGLNVNNRCTACGVCKKVCPGDNIVYELGIPKFKHQCEQCMACVAWCPNRAILPTLDENQVPYHHPLVKTKEMMVNVEEDLS